MKKVTKELELEICEMYKRGMSSIKISNIIKIHYSTISRYIKKHKLTRNYSERNKRYSVNEKFLDIITDEQAYFLGLMAADGNVYNNIFRLSQSHERGKEFLIKIKNMLNYNGNLTYSKKVDSFCLAVTCEKLVDNLISYGIVPNKSLIFQFPKKLNLIFLKSFMRGYIDGDGSVGIYRIDRKIPLLCISFVGTEEFIKTCYTMIPFRGILREVKTAKNLYEIRFYGIKAVDFGKWLWENKELPLYYKEEMFNRYINENKENIKFRKDFPEKINNYLKEMNNGTSPTDMAKKYNTPPFYFFTLRRRSRNGKTFENFRDRKTSSFD